MREEWSEDGIIRLLGALIKRATDEHLQLLGKEDVKSVREFEEVEKFLGGLDIILENWGFGPVKVIVKSKIRVIESKGFTTVTQWIEEKINEEDRGEDEYVGNNSNWDSGGDGGSCGMGTDSGVVGVFPCTIEVIKDVV